MEVQAKKFGIRFGSLTGLDCTKHDGHWLSEAKFWLGILEVDSNNMLELPIECDFSLLDLSQKALLWDQLEILGKVIKSLFQMSIMAAYLDIGSFSLIF